MKKSKRYNPNTFNAMHAAIAYLLFLGMMAGASVVLEKIIVSVRQSGKVITDIMPYMCLQSAIVAIGLLLVTLIMCAVARCDVLSGGGFLVRKGLGTEMLLAAVGTCGLAVVFAPLADSFSNSFEIVRRVFGLPSSDIDASMIGESGWLLLYVFVLVPVVPAVFEELLFRGVILRGFLQFGKSAAVILSALLFALAHGNVDQFIYQFLFGAVLGFLYVETRNILVCMTAHFTNNLFVYLSAIVSSGGVNASAVYSSIAEIMFVLIGAVCLVAAAVYFAKRAVHSAKNGERSRADVRAVFKANDPVLGDLTEEEPWFSTGSLARLDDEDKYYLTGNAGGMVGSFGAGGGRAQKLNKRSKFLPTAIVLGIGIVWSVLEIVLAFAGV